MGKNIIKLSVIVSIIFMNISCMTIPTNSLYDDAIREIRAGNNDFAYIRLNNYLRDYPKSHNNKKIKFAMAEYLFQIKAYRDAIYKLSEYIKEYAEDESAIFAQAILYKALSDLETEPELVQKIKENFFSRSLFLIFSESKIKKYKSLFNNTYEIKEYIDRIEIFKNNELFIAITA